MMVTEVVAVAAATRRTDGRRWEEREKGLEGVYATVNDEGTEWRSLVNSTKPRSLRVASRHQVRSEL